MRDIDTRQRLTKFFTHLLCITILFVLPEVLMSLSFPTRQFHMGMYAKAVVYIIVFYLNYYLIVDRSFGKTKTIWRFCGYNLLTILGALVLLYLIWRFCDSKPPMIRKHHVDPAHSSELRHIARWATFVSREIVMIVLTIGLAVALRLSDKWMHLAQQQKDLVSAQREEELKNLKSQLNPHFLFNTLNSIYALIAISPEKAQGAIHELSRLLRFVLYDSPATVTVEQEIDFIDNYIKLMRLRLNPAFPLNVNLDAGNCKDLTIAPLLFITIIENVFKHGVHPMPCSPIDISITAKDSIITCHTSNGIATEEIPVSTGTQNPAGGIGMQNLQRRLALLYGDNATLSVKVTPERYIVDLTIQLDNQPLSIPFNPYNS